MEHFDVAIVGGRVAGSALATHLARSGLSVLLLERTTMPSGTPSTHTIQEMSGLARLGILRPLQETGAPVMMRTTMWVDEIDLSVVHAALPRVSVRRITLDAVLAEAARRAGADIRQGCKVIDVCRRGERVSGLRYREPGGAERIVTCSLVVGADGRSSTVARLAGARRYDVTYNERGAVWQYFTGMDAPPEFYFCRNGTALLLAAPCDGGRTMLAVQPSLTYTPQFRAPGMVERSFLEQGAPWGESGVSWESLLATARPDGDPQMVLRYPCFFRESAGPGWALIGDAGHVKDVVTGQGISDALRQAELMTRHILTGWGADPSLDAALRRWWRARDRRARPMYWLSQDMGRAGVTPLVYRGFFRRASQSPDLRLQVQRAISQQQPIRKLTSVRRLAAVTGDLLLDGRTRGTGVIPAVWAAAALDVSRRAQGLRPRYELTDAPEPAPAPAAPAANGSWPGGAAAIDRELKAVLPGGAPLVHAARSAEITERNSHGDG